MSPLDQIPTEKAIELVVRTVYEDGGGQTKVVRGSVRNVRIGEPEGGWSAEVDIESPDGRDTLEVVYDGTEYSDTVKGAGEVRDDADTAHDLVRLAVKALYEQSNWTVLGISNLSVEGDILTVDAAMENADTGDRVVVRGTYDNSTNTWTDQLLQDIKGDGLRLDAPKKSGKGKGSGQPRKCNTGRPCGKSCIAKKTKSGKDTQCRQNPTGVVQQALSQATAAVGGGGTAAPANPSQQIGDILKAAATGPNGRIDLTNDQVGAIVAQAQQIYRDARKLAPDDATFYAGIVAGNATPDDWIHKQINQQLGYDGKPQQVTARAIDAAYNNGQYVAYRAMGSTPARFNQHFDNFKNGDFYAGHGIYGHGTYVAYAQQGGLWGRGVAHSAAASYGSGMMRLALADDAKVVDARDQFYDVRSVDRALKTWYQATGDRTGYRRARAVLIGDDSGDHVSGRLATLMGNDAISLTGTAYNQTYMVLLNRSKTLVQKTKGSMTRA